MGPLWTKSLDSGHSLHPLLGPGWHVPRAGLPSAHFLFSAAAHSASAETTHLSSCSLSRRLLHPRTHPRYSLHCFLCPFKHSSNTATKTLSTLPHSCPRPSVLPPVSPPSHLWAQEPSITPLFSLHTGSGFSKAKPLHSSPP